MDERLIRKAKAEAARTGTSLTRFIEEAVRQRLLVMNNRRGAVKKPVALPTIELVPRPGIELGTNQQIWEVLTAVDMAEGKLPSL